MLLQKELFDLIADKIACDPKLLRIPLENIERWIAADHSAPHRLRQWREIILNAEQSAEGLSSLLAVLRDQSESSVHLKSFDPFPGVLTTHERQDVLLRCGFAH